MPGTSRMETLASALAGMTVFAPAPVNPPGIPWTSSVGRAQVRSSTLYPFSPTSWREPTSAMRYCSSSKGRLFHAASSSAAGRNDVVVEAGDQDVAVVVL